MTLFIKNIKKRFILIFFISILCLGLIRCAVPITKPVALLISVATSYEQVILEVSELYKQQKPNVKIDYNFGPTKVLKEQIIKKFPIDIFISADIKIINELESSGLIVQGTRQNMMLKNEVALIVPKDSVIPISSFKDLANKQIKKVALGNEPLIAASQTKEILTSLGIYNQIKTKAVLTGQDLRRILKAVESKEADAGITYLTEAKLSNQVKIVAIAPENRYTPLLYTAAVIKGSPNVQEAKEFIEFLVSEKGKIIAQKYGFTLVK